MIHRVSVYLRHTSPHPSFPRSDRQHFSGNFPWQVENISIKHWIPRQRSLVLDNLSDPCRHILSSVHSIVDIPPFLFFFCFGPIAISSQRFISSHHFYPKWVNYWLLTSSLLFLSPQLNSAPLYRWRTGGFLNQPAATSPVKSRAWWRTRLRAVSRVLLNVPFDYRL